ncbi:MULTISPECIES: CpaE family protein [unclassified Bradyrhizobium]|uniref:AAA family ATPase n=1 Tax=unclassified Bradyrhizobium TaxID=2631580 RepID=UPI0028E8AF29|nr:MULTISPECIES: cellulose synthase operon protein YhjQ/BcsQ [unclassified Bradyrhizobium]
MDTPGHDPGRTRAREAAPVATVFVSDQDSEGVIRQSLSDLGVDDAEFKKGTVETAIAYLAMQPSPRLLFVDLSGVDDPLARIYELAERCEPSVSVVAIGDRNDIVLYRDLKNAGVSEYFFKPLIIDVVKAICRGILRDGGEHSPNQRTGKLVFVIGVRGGVGATTIAANAAWYLAEKRQRWVMVVDLDLHNGDAALQFDSTPGHALREAFEKPERVDRLFLERGTIHVRERLDLLAALEPLSESTTLAEDAVLSLLGKLLHRYRFVFVDLPSIVALGLAQVLHQPSVCVLVSDASLASARELSRWREWIGPNSAERRTLHVLNMNGADGALPESEFIRAVGRAPDIIIPYDRDIAMASKFGVKATRKCAVLNRGLTQLLRDLTGETDAPTRSIFSRVFG